MQDGTAVSRALGARDTVAALAAGVLVFLSLLGWGLASPPVSSPDEDLHIANIYCLHDSATCRSDDAPWPWGIPWWPWSPEDRTGPQWDAVREAYGHLWQYPVPREYPCFVLDADGVFTAANPGKTAECMTWEQLQGNRPGSLDDVGYYPNLGYRFLSLFTRDSIQASVAVWRTIMCLIAAVICVGSILLSPRAWRRPIAVTWLVIAVPLGMFLLSSINPSAWPLLGVAAAVGPGVAVVAAAREGRVDWLRIPWLGCAAFMIVAGRTEGPVFLVIAVVAILILGGAPAKHLLWSLAAVALIGAIATALGALQGLSDRTIGNYLAGSQGQLWEALMHLPSIVEFQGSRLGWLEILLPPIVTALAAAAYYGVLAVGLAAMDRRKGLVAIGTLSSIVVAYLVIWTRSGFGLQARYYLPVLFVFTAAVLAPGRGSRPQPWSRAQWAALGALLITANTVAVAEVTARYLLGTPPLFSNSDPFRLAAAGVPDWWWGAWVGPFANWVLAASAFATLVVGTLTYLYRLERHSDDTVQSSAAPSAEHGGGTTVTGDRGLGAALLP